MCEESGHILRVGQLHVLAPLGVVKKVLIASSLLERCRHQVVPPLPLVAVVLELLGPFVEGREFAVLARARDLVDKNGADQGAEGDVEGVLTYQLALVFVDDFGGANGSSPPSLRTYTKRFLHGGRGLMVAVA